MKCLSEIFKKAVEEANHFGREQAAKEQQEILKKAMEEEQRRKLLIKKESDSNKAPVVQQPVVKGVDGDANTGECHRTFVSSGSHMLVLKSSGDMT